MSEKVCIRHQYTVLPMTSKVIAHVEQIASEQNQPLIAGGVLLFKWRPNIPLLSTSMTMIMNLSSMTSEQTPTKNTCLILMTVTMKLTSDGNCEPFEAEEEPEYDHRDTSNEAGSNEPPMDKPKKEAKRSKADGSMQVDSPVVEEVEDILAKDVTEDSKLKDAPEVPAHRHNL